MTVKICVFPNKLNTTQFEYFEIEHGQTLTKWLQQTVASYHPETPPPFSATLNGRCFPVCAWALQLLQPGDALDLTVEAKEPMTIVMAVIAVVSAAVSIYAMNQIPDTYNSTTPTGSPIYDANAQGNQPRLMGVIPEIAGSHKTYPDNLNMPHRYYVDNVEYINLMLCAGVGDVELLPENVFVAETPAERYAGDINYQVFGPGANVSGHAAHKNMYTSTEIDGAGFDLETHKSKFSTGKDINSGRYVRTFENKFWFVVDGKNVDSMDWKAGDQILFDGINSPAEIFENVINVVNGEIQTGGGLSGVVVNDKITIVGLGADDGAYMVDSIAGTTLRVKTLAGAPFSLAATYATRVRILRWNHFSGLYEIIKKDDSTSWRVIRVGDPSWSEFPIEFNTWSGITAERTNGEIGNFKFGPYMANPQPETTNLLSLDFYIPGGLAVIDNDGDILPVTVEIEISYRKIGGAWQRKLHSFNDATLDDLGETVDITVAPGSYEVMIERLTPEANTVGTHDSVMWKRLKSELPTVSSYADVTTIALTMRGTNALSSSATKKFNIIPTRKLPVFENGAWTAPKPTRDIAPFFAHVIKDVGHTDAQIALDELARLDGIWQGRGDTFDAVFDSSSTLFAALKRILQPGFAEPSLDGGQLVPVRDEPRTVWEHTYQPDNMLGVGLERAVTLLGEDEPDGVEVEFFSRVTWKPETILCLGDGQLGINPEKLRAFGVTDRTKAYQLGMRKVNVRRYRRKQYSFKTEMDALNSHYMSFCALADNIPGYSQTGRVIAASGRKITLDTPLTWGAGIHLLALRKPDGRLSGPYTVTAGSEANQVVLASDLDFAPVINGRIEPPLFMFGVSSRWAFPALITDINPQGTDKVAVKAVNYDVRAYQDDNSQPPS